MVGWDNPLQTFFGQLYKVGEEGERVEEDEDGNDAGTLVWVGARFAEIRTVDDLERKLQPHVKRLPEDVRKELYLIEID